MNIVAVLVFQKYLFEKDNALGFYTHHVIKILMLVFHKSYDVS